MENLKHKIGRGSFSIILLILGLGFSMPFSNGICIGDYIVRVLGLEAWSEGNGGIHYTLFYSMIFFLPAWYLGDKYREDYGAEVGRGMSLIFTVLIIGWFIGYLL